MPVPQLSVQEIESGLKNLWGELLNIDRSAICSESRFFDFGGDSMLLISLQALLWSHFNKEMTTAELMKLDTFGDMQTALEQLMKPDTEL